MPQANDQAQAFAHYWRALAFFGASRDPTREYRFHPSRRWRFDFAWPEQKLAVEIDGGRWKPGGGRHATEGDYEKMNAAQLLGWTVLRYQTGLLLRDPSAVIEEVRQELQRRIDNAANTDRN